MSLEIQIYWYSWKYWWGTYVIYLGQFQTPALVIDSLLFFLLWKAMNSSTALAILASWIVFTKIVKLLPHFSRQPQDFKFLLVSLIFSYLHGLINIYALLTLHVTTWGSKDLEELKAPRAEDEEVVPLLRNAMAWAEPYNEPPGKMSHFVRSETVLIS